jgi:S1-C subfamily serine protease
MSQPSLALQRPRRLWGRIGKVVIGSLALTALVFSVALVLPSRAQAATRPGGNVQDPVVRAIDIDRPAVVRIETAFGMVSIGLHFCATENDTYVPKNSDGSPAGVGGLGSGTFISSTGDILTAGHVVHAPPGDLETFLLGEMQIASDIAALVKAHCHQTIDPANLVNIYLANPQLFVFTYSDPINKVWLDTSYHGPYTETDVRSSKYYPYTVKGIDEFETNNGGIGNDVSIIHVDGLTDMPSVPIGDSDAVSPTDTLTIIGYPGNGDANHYSQGQPVAVPNDFLTESINQVYVSAIKTNDSGGKLIQVGGNVEHGDSGGPALNAAGEVVGVVSFGGTDTPDGTSFMQAVSNAQSLIQQANIDTTPGTFENLWRQALTDFGSTASGHWHKAAQELQTIQTNYPNFHGADDYLTYAQQQAQNESSSGGGLNLTANTATLAGIGLGALAIIALVAIIIAAVAGRRRAPAVAVAAAPAERLVNASSGAPSPFSGPAPSNYPSASGAAASPYSSPPPPAPSGPPQYQPMVSVSTKTTCVNGHAMQPNEIRCATCGAPRAL